MLEEDTTIEDKVAKYRMLAKLYELAHEKREYQITADDFKDSFAIKGKLNNFLFEYRIYKHIVQISAQHNQHTIEINADTKDKIDSLRINEKSYNTIKALGHDLKQELADLIEQMIEKTQFRPSDFIKKEPSELYEAASEGKYIDATDYDEKIKDYLKIMLFGHSLYKRIKKELKEKIPEFFEIIEAYKRGEYHPPGEIPAQLTSATDTIEEFNLS